MMNADGSGVARLTGNLASTGLPIPGMSDKFRVAWAPDGSALAFSCAIESGNSDICTITVDGSTLTRLTTNAARDSNPAWSPDGRTIAFATERYGTTFFTGDAEVWSVAEIALMNPDGSGVRQLRASLAADHPAWSPDSARIAVDVMDYFDWWGGAYINVSVMNVDGTGAVTPAAGGSSAAWRPFAGNLPPMASFGAHCSAHTCTFGATSSVDPDGSIAGYAWDFGDGTTGSGATVSHTYATRNPHRVTLTVTDDSGTNASVSHMVDPNSRPVVWGRVSCNGVTCAFDSEAYDPDGTIVSHVWVFGDGSSAAGATVSHTYSLPGIHGATVTVTDNEGATASNTVTVVATAYPTASFTFTCDRLTCAFDASASIDPDGTIGSYEWYFGDGTTASGAIVSHTYANAGTYNMALDVRDNLGLQGFLQKSLTVAPTPLPTASFTSACSNLACVFDGSASTAPGGSIASYEWRLGDGSVVFGPIVSYTYRTPGPYGVILIVRDSYGRSTEQHTNLTVTASPAHVGDLDPTATKQSSLWTATVTVTIHGVSHALLADATVRGSWGDGSVGTCVTNVSGRCSVALSRIARSKTSMSFSVSSVSHAGGYESHFNHDSDADSNGTTIVVKRP